MSKISIIMPNYNGEKFLERSISSFLDSSWKNKELIIVDGKSTDLSHSIISEYVKNCENIIWVKNADNGISDAINIGLSYSSGEIIGYLGSDDLLLCNALEIVANFKKINKFDGIYFDSYTFNLKTNTTKYRACPRVDFNKNNLLKFGTLVGLQNIFFSIELFEHFKFDVNNKYSMDYDFYLRILEKYTNFIYVNRASSLNIAHDNITNTLTEKQSKEAFGVAKKHITNIKTFILVYFSKRLVLDFLRRFK